MILPATALPDVFVTEQTPALIAAALASVPDSVTNGRKNESIIARHLIAQAVSKRWSIHGFVPASDAQGFPLWESQLFWSLSHKDRWVGVAVADHPVGIDVEVLTERDPSLFSLFSDHEWDLLGEKQWRNFYRLWTAKEAVIKRERVTLDMLPKIRLVGMEAGDLVLAYDDARFPVRFVQSGDCLYSFTL